MCWFMLQVREGFVCLLKISDIRSCHIHGEGSVSRAWNELQLCLRAVAAPHPASHWSWLTIHTDKLSHQEMPLTTWKNTQNVNTTKLALKILGFFFKASMLGCYLEHFVYLFCVHFTLHSSTHFGVQGNLFSFYLVFYLHCLRCGFSGMVGGLQCLCQ